MPTFSETTDISHLIETLVQERFPGAVYFANEKGYPPGIEKWTMMDSPRLSLCLSGIGRYLVRQGGQLKEITLQRGDMIFVQANCFMDPHHDARYRSLGIVFSSQLTRFLIAEKFVPPQHKPNHRFLFSHHSSEVLDLDGKNLLEAVGRAGSRGPTDLYLRQLSATLLLKTSELLNQKDPIKGSGKAQLTWQAARQFVQEHLQEPIGRQEVATFLRLHPNHLSRLFTRYSKRSFNRYLMEARLMRSQELLRDPRLSLAEISLACGFTDANYFIRAHRKFFGKPPGKARGDLSALPTLTNKESK